MSIGKRRLELSYCWPPIRVDPLATVFEALLLFLESIAFF